MIESHRLLDADTLRDYYAGRTDAVNVRDNGSWRCVRNPDGDLNGALREHAAGKAQAAVYPLLDDGTVRFATIDVDSHGTEDVLRQATAFTLSYRLQDRLRTDGIFAFLSVSKSGTGNYHLDMYFDSPIEAAKVRRVILASVDAELIRLDSDGKDRPGVEVFPKVDRLAAGSIGNAISLPHFPPAVEQGATIFIDRHNNPVHPDLVRTDVAVIERLHRMLPPLDQSRREPSDHGASLFAEAPEGTRHNSLTRIIGHLKAKGLDPKITERIAHLWNDSLKSPLPAREVAVTVASLCRGSGFAVAKSLDLFRGDSMASMPIEDAADLIAGLLRRKSLGFIAGEEGSGKSLLAMNLAIAVAVASPRFLEYDLDHSGPVIFLNNELYFEDVVRRFQNMTKTVPGRGPLSNFIAPREVPPLAESFGMLDDLCTAEKPVLVLLDCLYFAHNEDENDSSKMKDLMRQLQTLRDKHGTCVLVVHHLRKGGRDQRLNSELMRGAGVFGAAADSVLMLRRSQTDEAKRILKPTKLRHSGDKNKTARLLSLHPETLWFRDEGPVNEDDHMSTSPTAQDVLDIESILESGPTQFRDILKACEGYGFNSKTVQRQINELVDRGKVVKLKHGTYGLPGEMDTCPKGVQTED